MPKITNRSDMYLSRNRKIAVELPRDDVRVPAISAAQARKRFENAKVDERLYLNFSDPDLDKKPE